MYLCIKNKCTDQQSGSSTADLSFSFCIYAKIMSSYYTAHIILDNCRIIILNVFLISQTIWILSNIFRGTCTCTLIRHSNSKQNTCSNILTNIKIRIYEPRYENRLFAYAKTKTQISFAVTAKLLSFRYMDSTIPLLPKSEISSLYPSSVAVRPGLCGTWSETPKTIFLTMRLICTCFIEF